MPSLKKVFNFLALILLFSQFQLSASPVVPMNKAFNSFIELVPFLSSEKKFKEKENEKIVGNQIKELSDAFKMAKHDALLKQDIFAPSLESIKNDLQISNDAFSKGNKDYAWWRMRSLTSQCLSCHTRLPENISSSFQDGSRLINPTKFSNNYDLGMARFLVRQYAEAKESFTMSLDESIVKNDLKNILPPLKQILVIQTKVFKDTDQMQRIVNFYLTKKEIPSQDKDVLRQWEKRLKIWSKGAFIKWKRLSTNDQVDKFMKEVLSPLFKKNNLYIGNHDVDLLMAQGILSNYLFENPTSAKAPDAIYWVGMTEKFLERENFVGTGDLFFKECILKYPKSSIARECLNEYKESIEFNFSGSRGTDIPADIKDELKRFENLLK